MDLSTAALFGVVLLLALNQVVMRTSALWRRDGVFFGAAALQVLAGTLVMGLGMPGFEALPSVSWVLGLMFFLHVGQNLSLRSRRLRELDAEEAEARRDVVRAALEGSEAGEATSRPPAGP